MTSLPMGSYTIFSTFRKSGAKVTNVLLHLVTNVLLHLVTNVLLHLVTNVLLHFF